jgi:hypothetical protein
VGFVSLRKVVRQEERVHVRLEVRIEDEEVGPDVGEQLLQSLEIVEEDFLLESLRLPLDSVERALAYLQKDLKRERNDLKKN